MPDSQEPTSDPQADGANPATPGDTPDQAPESPKPSESAQDTSSESASESGSEIEAEAGTVASQTETSGEPDKDSPSDKGPNLHRPEVQEALARYWRANLLIMGVLLGIWAFVGLGCGILFADVLNQYVISGIPLGFWFAQQGSIIVFVLLILIYCLLLNRLDRKHHEELVKLRSTGEG